MAQSRHFCAGIFAVLASLTFNRDWPLDPAGAGFCSKGGYF